jgi:beta-glucosidase
MVIDMSWAANVQAVVHGFLHGQAGAAALLDIIFGRVNPSGKIAETYPIKIEDTPAYGNYPSANPASEYFEGLSVGYRHYEAENIPVAYPFGFGLSYAAFEYSDLTVNETGAAFLIKNTSGIDGDEIAQLYVKKTGGSVFRPLKELKGFKRVTVKAGISVRVSIPFDDKTFRYFSVKTNKWEIEDGEYQILIGTNASDICLNSAITISGTIEETVPRAELPASPPNEWLKNGVFAPNNTLGQAEHCKNGFLRFASRFVLKRTRKIGKDGRGRVDLNMIFVYNMPFRAIARNAGFIFTTDMVDGVVAIANGHSFKGLGHVVSGLFRNRKLNKQDEAKLLESGS